MLEKPSFRSTDTFDPIELDLKDEPFDPILQSAGHFSSNSLNISIFKSSFSGIASITNHALLKAGAISVKDLVIAKQRPHVRLKVDGQKRRVGRPPVVLFALVSALDGPLVFADLRHE